MTQNSAVEYLNFAIEGAQYPNCILISSFVFFFKNKYQVTAQMQKMFVISY